MRLDSDVAAAYSVAHRDSITVMHQTFHFRCAFNRLFQDGEEDDESAFMVFVHRGVGIGGMRPFNRSTLRTGTKGCRTQELSPSQKCAGRECARSHRSTRSGVDGGGSL